MTYRELRAPPALVGLVECALGRFGGRRRRARGAARRLHGSGVDGCPAARGGARLRGPARSAHARGHGGGPAFPAGCVAVLAGRARRAAAQPACPARRAAAPAGPRGAGAAGGGRGARLRPRRARRPASGSAAGPLGGRAAPRARPGGRGDRGTSGPTGPSSRGRAGRRARRHARVHPALGAPPLPHGVRLRPGGVAAGTAVPPGRRPAPRGRGARRGRGRGGLRRPAAPVPGDPGAGRGVARVSWRAGRTGPRRCRRGRAPRRSAGPSTASNGASSLGCPAATSSACSASTPPASGSANARPVRPPRVGVQPGWKERITSSVSNSSRSPPGSADLDVLLAVGRRPAASKPSCR